MCTALILIDIQNDYFPNGKNELHLPDQAAQQAAALLSFFRTNRLPIIHVQHVNIQPTATFFRPNTHGAAIHDSVSPQANEHLIIKHTPDSFLHTDLQGKLVSHQIEKLLICGMMTHMCIDTSVRSAKAHGYEIELIADACTTKDLVWQDQFIAANTVQATYLASLNNSFATVLTAHEWLSRQTV